MNTPTPRTDALQNRVCDEADRLIAEGRDAETRERMNDLLQEAYDHARQLERELAAAQERIRELETALLGVKEYREKNPLGGPAKVFDAMADAIRAGDDLNAVCSDYGWCPVERAQAAEARAEKNARDAERYRWLRDVHAYHYTVTRYIGGATIPRLNGASLDAAIDAAIAARDKP